MRTRVRGSLTQYEVNPARVEELTGYLAEWKQARVGFRSEVERLAKELKEAKRKLDHTDSDIADAVCELKYRHGVKDITIE